MQKVSEGEVNVLGTNLAELNEKQRDKFRAQHIGLVFQQMNLVPYLTVKDNILLAALLPTETFKTSKNITKNPTKSLRENCRSTLKKLM